MNARFTADAALAVSAFVAVGGHTHQTFDLIAPQWAGAACLALAALAVSNRRAGAIAVRADLALGAFVAYALASLAWSPVPLAGTAFVAKAAFFFCLVWSLRRIFEAGRETPVLIGVAAAVCQALLVAELPPRPITIGGFANPNYLIETLLMALPWIVAFAVRRGRDAGGAALWLLAAATIWYALIEASSKIPILVFGGLLALAAPIALRRWGLLGLALGLGALGGIAWGAASRGIGSFARSLGERGEIFLNSLAIARDNLPFGGGAGAFGALYPLYQEGHLALLPDNYLIVRRVLVGAAHNDLLQVAIDFGLVGVAVVLLAAAFAVTDGFRARAKWRLAACVSLAAGGLASLVGFPFQNPSSLTLAALAAAALTAREADETAHTAPERGFAWARASVAVLSALFLAGAIANVAAYHQLRLMLVKRHPAPDSAYAAHARANALAPWDAYIGQTLFITYMSWSVTVDRRYTDYPLDRVAWIADPLVTGPDNAQVHAMSRRYAPYNFNLGYGRLQYLLNARLHRTHADEIDALLREMQRAVPNLPETVVLSAYAAAVRGDETALATAVDSGRRPGVRWRPEMRAALDAVLAAHARAKAAGDRATFDSIIHLEW